MDNFLTTFETDFDSLLKTGSFTILNYSIDSSKIFNGGLNSLKTSSKMPLIEYEIIPKNITSPTMSTEFFDIDIIINVWTQAKLNTTSKQALKNCLNLIENSFKKSSTFLNKFGIPTKNINVIYDSEPMVFTGVVGWSMTISVNCSNAL